MYKEIQINTNDHITPAQAKKSISKMNLINGFLFDSALEHEDEAKIIVGNILKAVFFRKFTVQSVTSQKPLQSIDTNYHGIRLDVLITEDDDGNNPTATVYDMEMEDRPSDKNHLPKRLRYYNALHDTKALESGDEYDKLPDFISIVILSYDLFNAGDMYYEAKTTLITHPQVSYENGVRSIFLYCNGKPNFNTSNSRSRINQLPEHSKMLQEMLKYIVSGEKPAVTNSDIEEIDTIVTKVKGRKEVTIAYMRQWDRELSIKREIRQEDALEIIRFGREDGISDDKTRARLKKSFGYNNKTIDELFAIVDAEALVNN